MKRIILAFLFLIGANSYAKTASSPLSLENYLEQVKFGNNAYKGSKAAAEGASLAEDGSNLVTRPWLVGEAHYVDDRRETGNVIIGDKLRNHKYKLGVRQVTDFGLAGTLSYQQGYTIMPEGNPAFVETEYYEAGPILELKQSLWRNGFGTETRFEKQKNSAAALQIKHSSNFAMTEVISTAEAFYWRLALAREAVALAKENLERAQKLRGWSSSRQKSGLGDRSDYLQASSAYLSRELELKSAVDEERSAARAFNTLRGIRSETVPDILAPFDSAAMTERLRMPDRAKLREDVRAAEQSMRAKEAEARLAGEKARPIVDLVASLSHNGRDLSKSEADEEARKDDHPAYMVGLKLEIPLDVGTSYDTVKGFKTSARAAQLEYDAKRFEIERTWDELSAAFQDGLARYKLAAEIEKANKDKMENERERHSRGRSTTFQVIQFETEYSLAQWNRIKTQVEILNTYAKLKTFGGSNQ